MAFKKPQVNKLITDIKSLTIYLRTLKKFGKSTLFRDVIMEKYGDPERGLLVGVGAEMGYTLLDKLNHTHVETWEDLVELKDWLIEEKGNEHNIELVAFDVVDEMFPIVEKEVIRLSVIETKKACKSIKSAFGGYNAGAEMTAQMVKDYFLDLKKAEIGVWAIAHTKFKNIKQKGDIDDGYMSLSSTLQSNYESVFGDVFDCVLTGYIDRAIEQEVVGVDDDGKDKVKRKATDEIRKLYLRGNTFIDAGCRFRDGSVPEYIVFDKPNMAKDFIETMEEGIRLSASNPSTVAEFKQKQADSQKEEDEQAEKFREEKKAEKDEPVFTEEDRQTMIKTITSKFKSGSAELKATVKEILNGTKLTEADAPTLNKILNTI